VNVPTDADLEFIVVQYRSCLEFDVQNAPSPEAKKQLARIEKDALKLLKDLEGANRRALDTLCMQGEITGGEESLLTLIPYFDNSAGQAVLGPIAERLNRLSAAARLGRDDIPRYVTRMAQRIAAASLRDLFSKRGLTFSATADERGVTSHAVATLVKVARLAGDTAMTDDSARQWVRAAKRETLGRETVERFPDDGLPIS
jgi:hypothetical protein